jgi:hypothetical protein
MAGIASGKFHHRQLLQRGGIEDNQKDRRPQGLVAAGLSRELKNPKKPLPQSGEEVLA